jgi:hypothetical protein
MVPQRIEIGLILAEEKPQMRLAEDHEVVQHFLFNTLHSAFRGGIAIGGPRPNSCHFHFVGGQGGRG